MAKNKFSLNYWPSFTDLMLSLVLVMICILSVYSIQAGLGQADIERSDKSIKSINEQIKQEMGDGKVAVIKSYDELENNSDKDVIIVTDLNKQVISFNEAVLFSEGRYKLLPRGAEDLDKLGPVIYKNLPNIAEIRIEAHTDIVDTADFNLTLGAQRAIEVYNRMTFRNNDNPNTASEPNWKINPAEHLISISSYGKFKPVGRNPGDDFNMEKLIKANPLDKNTESQRIRARNRRIEIIIEYKHRK